MTPDDRERREQPAARREAGERNRQRDERDDELGYRKASEEGEYDERGDQGPKGHAPQEED